MVEDERRQRQPRQQLERHRRRPGDQAQQPQAGQDATMEHEHQEREPAARARRRLDDRGEAEAAGDMRLDRRDRDGTEITTRNETGADEWSAETDSVSPIMVGASTDVKPPVVGVANSRSSSENEM